MDDLIKRADAIEEISKGVWNTHELIDRINALPSAEAVEVVRCKDCRHRDLFSCPLADNDFQKDDDFCSWGERGDHD